MNRPPLTVFDSRCYGCHYHRAAAQKKRMRLSYVNNTSSVCLRE